MNILQKLFGKVDYLKERVEFDRRDPNEKREMFISHSDWVIEDLETDIKSGKGIKERIDLTFYGGKNCVTEGCHRVAAADNCNLTTIPARLILKGRLGKNLLKRFSKFKDI